MKDETPSWRTSAYLGLEFLSLALIVSAVAAPRQRGRQLESRGQATALLDRFLDVLELLLAVLLYTLLASLRQGCEWVLTNLRALQRVGSQ